MVAERAPRCIQRHIDTLQTFPVVPLPRAPRHEIVHGHRVSHALAVYPVLRLFHQVRQRQLYEYHDGAAGEVYAHAPGGDRHERDPAVVVVAEPFHPHVTFLAAGAAVEANVRKPLLVAPVPRHLSQNLVLDVVHHGSVVGEHHRLGHLLQGIRVVLLLLLGHVAPVPRSHVAAALLDTQQVADPLARAPRLRQADRLHLGDGARAVGLTLAVHAVVLEVHAVFAEFAPSLGHIRLGHVDVHLLALLGR